MENNRKTELNNFLDYIPENNLVAIYYIDKSLNIPHYTIYDYSEIPLLREKAKHFNNDLEDDLIKVLQWRTSDSKDYLTGVYDGLIDATDEAVL